MLSYQTLLKQFEDYSKTRKMPAEPASLYEPIAYIMELGGKRLRPVLALLAHQLAKPVSDKAFQAGYAIEVFHNFSLVHDDIMDHAPMRRGNPTVHRKWDEATGILSGDQMLIMAFREMREATGDLEVLEKFEQIATEVCEGQRMDMDFEVNEDVSIPEYIAMIRRKTAVLLGFALWTGGKLAGLSSNSCNNLYDYGCEVGIGFQIMDDLLDCYGGNNFGKKIGGDIIAGKKTILHLQCLAIAGNEERKLLKEAKEQDIPEGEKIDLVLDLYDKFNVKERVEQTMAEYFIRARELERSISADNETDPDALNELAQFIDLIRVRNI